MFSRLLIRPLKLNKSFFLFGPRGTGKTTWLKNNLPDSIYIDLLDAQYYNELLAYPNRIKQFIPPKFKKWIIIDEIQKIPKLLNEIHRLIETNKYKFIMTGSSARSLRKKGVNLLAGRALTFFMYPLCVEEIDKKFNLEFSLNYGQMPAIFSEPDKEAYLKTYIKTYLQEEVLQEGLTRNLSNFSRFLETASFSQAQVLNITEVARECSIERKTVENYFSILEDLLISIHLPVFTKKAKRRMLKHPKFYFFDAGIYRSIRPKGPLDSPEEIDGAALETLLFQELRAVNDYYNYQYGLFYWRTSNGLEVDFILYGKKGILALEIKRTNKIKNSHLKGLKAFKSDYPMAKCYLLYSGNIIKYYDGITAMPINTALKKLSEILNNK